MDEASIGMTVDRTEAHVSGTGKRTGVATPATGVMHQRGREVWSMKTQYLSEEVMIP
jgi:hypothetical protein